MRCVRAIVIALMPAIVLASDPNQVRGFSPDRVYQIGDVDHVNVLNGNVIVRLPLGQVYRAGPTLEYQLALTYNSKIWDYKFEDYSFPGCESDPVGCSLRYGIPEKKSNAGFGWTLSLGRLIPATSEAPLRGWIYAAPDGSEHEFTDVISPPPPEAPGIFDPVRARTADGSFLRLDRYSPDRRDVSFPDGHIKTFDAAGNLTEMRDRHGNWIRIAYTAAQWTITDGYGEQTARTHTIALVDKSGVFTQPNFQTLIGSVTLQVFDDPQTAGGETATYVFSYEDRWVGRGGGGERASGHPDKCVTVPLLGTIGLPDGTLYEQTYKIIAGSLDTIPDSCIDPPGDPGFGVLDADSGVIQSMRLPLRGSIEWVHGLYSMNLQECINGAGYEAPYLGVKSRSFKDADGTEISRWSYTPSLVPFGSTTSQTCEGSYGTIPAPAEELINEVEISSAGQTLRTRHFFSAYPRGALTDAAGFSPNGFTWKEYGLPLTHKNPLQVMNPLDPATTVPRLLSTEVVDCSGACSTLRRDYVQYEYGEQPYVERVTNARLTAERTVHMTDTGCAGSCFADIQRGDYDGFGHYRKAVSTSNFPGSVERTSFTNHTPDPDRWLLEKYAESWTKQESAGSAAAAKRIATFDESLGVLTSLRFLGPSGSDPQQILPSPNDLLTVWCRDTGTTAGSRGFVTSERRVGGDLAPIPVVDVCNSPRAEGHYYLDHAYTFSGAHLTGHTAGYAGTSFLTIDHDLDAASGLVRTSRDTAGLATTYRYDLFGRLVEVRPPAQAWTRYLYQPAASPPRADVEVWGYNVTPSPSPVSDALRDDHHYYDGLGRLILSKTRMPSASGVPEWATTVTAYDGFGRVSSVSMPTTRTTSAYETIAPSNVTTYGWDVLGRPVSTLAPDGTATRVAYSGTRARTVSLMEADGVTTRTRRTEEYDGLGRLVAVTEPGGATSAGSPAGENVKTTYGHDMADRLVSVSSTEPGTQAPVTQMRLFSYDGRGFLQSEQHPESGTTSYQSYDAGGRPGLRLVNGANDIFDLRFTYDDAERLVRVESRNPPEYDSTTFRVSKEFIYGTANSGTNRKLGKLETAVRRNHHPTLGQITVSETYGYDDGAARLTSKQTSITGERSLSQSLLQSYAYDELNQTVRTGYPECWSVPCGEAGWNTIEPGYQAGRLRGVPGFTASGAAITYHPSGTLASVPHVNGVIETHERDLHEMTRPRSIAFSGYTNCTAASISAHPSSQTILYGSSATLSVAGSGSGTVGYQWYEGTSGDPQSVKIEGATSPSYTTPVLTYTSTYWVRAANACGAADSVTATVRVKLGTPGGLVAVHSGPGQISVWWNAVADAHHYELERRSNGSGFSRIADPPSGSHADGSLAMNTSYVYRVRAADSQGVTFSDYSNLDVSTTMSFSSVAIGGTIRSSEFEEILGGVNAVRAAAGSAAVGWAGILPGGTPAPAPGVPVYRAHVESLRTQMDLALEAIGVPREGYTDPQLEGALIRAVHVNELQERTQ